MREPRVSQAPLTPRMANAPATPEAPPIAARAGDTSHSRRDDLAAAASPPAGGGAEKKNDRPRTDTIALVEQNAAKGREVPTWLAVVAIVALSLVAGMTTYLIRLKATSDSPAATSTTSATTDSSSKGSAAKITPDESSSGGSKR